MRMKKYDGSSHTPIIFPDPSSLGYAIQGISLLNEFIKRAPGNLYVEADPRLIPLFERSYKHPCVKFIPTEKSEQIPLPNNGKPQTADELDVYFSANAERLADKLNLSRYAWSTLLRHEIAAPFNVHAPTFSKVIKPKPGYLDVRNGDYLTWREELINDDPPILVNWNKGFSQHGDAAKQNLDAQDVADIITQLGKSVPLRLSFYNATHGITPDDLNAVNGLLPKSLHMRMIRDPYTKEVFDLGTKLDKYSAFMYVCQEMGGLMLGVGNTYQHMWYAVGHRCIQTANQIITLPDGDFSTKATWELQAKTSPLITTTVDKVLDPKTGRMNAQTVARIAQLSRKALCFE